MYQVWEKYMQYQAQNEKVGGPGALLPGKPLFVVPGTGASAFNFVNTNHKNVYTDINSAFAAMTAGQGDCVVPLPGAHTLTANLAWNVAQTYLIGPELFFGVPCQKSSAIITAAAGAKGITITAADVMIAGVTCVPVTTKSFIDFSVAAARLRLDRLFLDLITPAASTSTKGIVATGAAPEVHFSRIVTWSGGAQGPAMDLTGILRAVIEGCEFEVSAGSWAVAVQCGAGMTARLRQCHFGGYGTALTVAVDGTGVAAANALELTDNRVGVVVGTAFKNFAVTSYATLALNYVETIGGGTGGTLLTSIT